VLTETIGKSFYGAPHTRLLKVRGKLD